MHASDGVRRFFLRTEPSEKLNVPAVDLFPLLRKDYLDNKQDLYIYDKMHWNERANRVIADSVMKTIQKPFAASADTSN